MIPTHKHYYVTTLRSRNVLNLFVCFYAIIYIRRAVRHATNICELTETADPGCKTLNTESAEGLIDFFPLFKKTKQTPNLFIPAEPMQ